MPRGARVFDTPGSNLPRFNNWRLPVPPVVSFDNPELTTLEIVCPVDLRKYICGLISLIYEPNLWSGSDDDRKALSEFAQNYVKGCDDMPLNCDVVYECLVGDSRIQDLLRDLIEQWSVENWSLPSPELEELTVTEQLDCLWTASEQYVNYIFDEITQISIQLEAVTESILGVASLFPLLDTALQASLAGTIQSLVGSGAALIQLTSEDQDIRRQAACELFTLIRCNSAFPYKLEREDHKNWSGQLLSKVLSGTTDDAVLALFAAVLGLDATLDFIELISFSEATVRFVDGLNDCDDGWSACGDCPAPSEFPTIRVRPNGVLGAAGDPAVLPDCPPAPGTNDCQDSPERCRRRYSYEGIGQYFPNYIGSGKLEGQGIQMSVYLASDYAPSPVVECASVNLGGFFNSCEFRIYVTYTSGGVELVHQEVTTAGPKTVQINRSDVDKVIFWTLNSEFDVTQDSWRVQCAENILEDAECFVDSGTAAGAYAERRVVCG